MSGSSRRKRPKGSVTLPEQYGVTVGSLWVAIDFKAEALYVTVNTGRSAKTVDLGNGVLIDYDEQGAVTGVEVIG